MSLQFSITREFQVLEQYYQLRERCFRSELGLADFDGSEDEQDRHSHIMVALRDGRCVGGVRISSHFSLRRQIDQLGLDHETCCVWERFVIDPAVRTLSLFREFSLHLIAATRGMGYQNAMVLSSLANARFYRRCHTALGVQFQIHRPVPYCAQGVFSGLEHYLSVAHLGRSQPQNYRLVSGWNQ